MSFPRELLDEFSRGNGSVFIGAGVSMGAGLPSWDELVRPLSSEITDCPPNSGYLDLAQFYVNEHGRRLLIDRLRSAIRTYRAKPTDVHRALVRLPVRRIFTTNFDGLLEAALSETEVQFTKVVNTDDVPLIGDSAVQLFKLHGDIDQASSIVITAEDYENYFYGHPAIADLLKTELQTQTVLFVGYSFTDADLKLILRRVGREVREMRKNLFTIQIAPTVTAVRDLEARGLKVISIPRGAGVEETNAALGEWLSEFGASVRQTLESPRITGARQLTSNNLPPRTGELHGREAEFTRVLEGLRSRYPLITIEGFAGVGKTSLAVEVGHACTTGQREPRPDAVIFDYVVWVSAKDKPEQGRWLDDVLNTVAITTNSSALTKIAPTELKQKQLAVEHVIRLFKTLIIVDNFETIHDADLVAWLERIPEPSKALVTTRDRQLQQKAWAVNLQGLQPAEAISMLRQHAANTGMAFVEKVSDDVLIDLCNATGGNPQAMKLALGLGLGGTVSLAEVIRQLKGSGSQQGIDALFKGLFEQSWGQLTENAKRILLVTPLFVGVSSIRRDALQAASGVEGSDANEALSHCIRLNLLEVEHDRGRYAIHPMTRAFARTQLMERPDFEAESKQRCIDYFRAFVRKTVIRENPTRRYWNALVSDTMLDIDPEWPSIQQVMAWADEATKDEVLVDLVMMLVHYMDSRFYNFERLNYVQRAITALQRRAVSEEHQAMREHRSPSASLLRQLQEDEALLRIDTLGWTYVEENRLRDAYREILNGFKIAEGLQGSERSDLLALGYAWRARVLIEQNDATSFDEARIDEPLSAEALIDQALAIESSAWIRTRVNMAAGDIALKQGNSNEALKRYEAAEAEAEKYGNEGRGYQTAPRIGLAYLAAGRLDEAEKRFRQLRDLEQIAIGQLYADYGLAMVAYKRGEIVGARGIIEATRTKLSRRTSSNLLLKLINKLYDDLELT